MINPIIYNLVFFFCGFLLGYPKTRIWIISLVKNAIKNYKSKKNPPKVN